MTVIIKRTIDIETLKGKVFGLRSKGIRIAVILRITLWAFIDTELILA